ncbi:MAG TPA: nuclear transport factor 2 family protein [Galbitalea sp.]|jgi:ketosteroid isomerase-like protein|nr:nuclear transport factor 2 family protein [Galbitalea sp.]
MSEATETAERFLDRTVTDISTLADLYAEHAVIEMPFASPLFPTRREVTRDELRAGFTRAGGPRYTGTSDIRIHETADPNTAVLEYRLHGVVTAHEGQQEFALDYIMVITTQNGLIVRSRDYSSLFQAAQAMGLTERLIAALNSTD